MRDFLLEIGTEEIPARCLLALSDSLKEEIEKALVNAKLRFDTQGISVFSTYRRLAVLVPGLSEVQEDYQDIQSGPPLSMARNEKGEWLAPALGFAKKVGIDPSELSGCIGKDAKGREMLSYVKPVKGKQTAGLLLELLPQVLGSITLPVAMRWGNNESSFYRPIQWIVSLFGDEIIPFSFFDVTAGNMSRGHRFLTANEEGSILGSRCLIANPLMYVSSLEKQFVCVDQSKRRERIRKELSSLGTSHPDSEALLEEVINLVEWPTVLEGIFDQKYLELPSEVLSKTMMSHQRYFPIFLEKCITNRFAIVAENVSEQNRLTIIEGNERVIVARLEDARFFFSEDKKKPLSDYVDGLGNVVFQKGMGSLFDKKERVKVIALHISYSIGFTETEKLDRACELCKADLVTHMVYEFPELQGIMGSYYAALNNEGDDVCLAIREHYYPVASGSVIPSTTLGKLIAIADRVDTIVVCYQNGLIPTGSKDPLGVRRAMMGLLSIVYSGISLNFIELFQKGYSVLQKGEGNFDALLSFFTQRVQTFIEFASTVPYDIALSVTPVALTRLVDACSLAKMLNDMKMTSPEAFKGLVEAAVRVNRLSNHHDTLVSVNPTLFVEDCERTIWDHLQTIDEKSMVDISDLEPLIKLLEEYFEKIMVLVEDQSLRNNRLSFLSAINKKFLSVADFEKIVIGS